MKVQLAIPSLVLLAFAGCPASRQVEELNEVVQRQAEAERRLRSENRDLAKQIRELKARLDDASGAETGPASESDAKDAKIREMSGQISRLLAALESQGGIEPMPKETPSEVAGAFVESVLASDDAGIEARTDWAQMADEAYRRGNSGGGISELPEKRRDELVSSTRKGFMEVFRSGRGREVLAANYERWKRGSIESGTVRVDLGEEAANAASRWSILLRRTGMTWKVVGVLNEIIEIPEDTSGLDDSQGSGR